MAQRIASPLFASSLLALGLVAGLSETAFATSLDDLRWKARPLVLFAPAADDPRLSDQLGQLKAAAAGLKDRDMVVLTVLAPQDPLRARLKAPQDGFLMVLVGKDGHIAQRWTTPQTPGSIFALIDRMPMRRDEMRRDGQ
ncbi:DUF4174 domain-containing protein [Azorhizobium sp. AG788]|uniref:DUF4174 domain-containing protein n=1 Tax=Azorhizobium sp. AG788 TaxID=2183897 RepID=UPI003139CDDD